MHHIYKTSTQSEWGWCCSAKLILGFGERDTWQHILKLLQVKVQQIKKVINNEKEGRVFFNSLISHIQGQVLQSSYRLSNTKEMIFLHSMKWLCTYKVMPTNIIITTSKRSIAFCSTIISTVRKHLHLFSEISYSTYWFIYSVSMRYV